MEKTNPNKFSKKERFYNLRSVPHSSVRPTRDLYRHYVKNHKEYPTTEREYSDIIRNFASVVMDVMMDDKIVDMPYLGYWYIRKTKGKKKIDYKTTQKLGKTVYYNNDHSQDQVYAFDWIPKNNLRFSRVYSLFPSKDNLKMLGKHILQGNDFKLKLKGTVKTPKIDVIVNNQVIKTVLTIEDLVREYGWSKEDISQAILYNLELDNKYTLKTKV